MLRGLYTITSGMLVNQQRLDIIANNLANASTIGYKRETVLTQSFQDVYVARLNDETSNQPTGSNLVGQLGIGTMVAQVATRLTTGHLKLTDNKLDVAIIGDGFFTINTPGGIRYTRNGSFMQDAQGKLITAEGYEVLVDGNPAVSLDAPMRIDQKGEVWAGSESLGKLSIATSADLGSIRKEGNGLWTVAGQGEPPAVIVPSDATGTYELRVGYVESANVEPVIEMVEMMTSMRSYEAGQRTFVAMDQALEKAVNEVGRVG